MKIDQPTTELAVTDVVESQHYFRDRLGFQVEWHNEAGRLGAVSHGKCALFFRQTDGEIHPSVHWIFTLDIDAAYNELVERGADIVDPVEDKPWGLRQFTVRDLNGHIYHFHHDLK